MSKVVKPLYEIFWKRFYYAESVLPLITPNEIRGKVANWHHNLKEVELYKVADYISESFSIWYKS